MYRRGGIDSESESESESESKNDDDGNLPRLPDDDNGSDDNFKKFSDDEKSVGDNDDTFTLSLSLRRVLRKEIPDIPKFNPLKCCVMFGVESDDNIYTDGCSFYKLEKTYEFISEDMSSLCFLNYDIIPQNTIELCERYNPNFLRQAEHVARRNTAWLTLLEIMNHDVAGLILGYIAWPKYRRM
jgi:hypothetical protein